MKLPNVLHLDKLMTSGLAFETVVITSLENATQGIDVCKQHIANIDDLLVETLTLSDDYKTHPNVVIAQQQRLVLKELLPAYEELEQAYRDVLSVYNRAAYRVRRFAFTCGVVYGAALVAALAVLYQALWGDIHRSLDLAIAPLAMVAAVVANVLFRKQANRTVERALRHAFAVADKVAEVIDKHEDAIAE